MKHKNHWLRSAKLPIEAENHHPILTTKDGKFVWQPDIRRVIVSAIDTHGAIVRRKGCGRYYAPLEQLEKI
jgi:hypothetical protein